MRVQFAEPRRPLVTSVGRTATWAETSPTAKRCLEQILTLAEPQFPISQVKLATLQLSWLW